MAESSIPDHPVPKPRISKQHPKTYDSDSIRSQSDHSNQEEDELVTDLPPYSSLHSPQEQDPVQEQEPVSDQKVVLRKKKTPPPAKPLVDNDYEDIDAHLDSEANESMRRSDYINWVFIDSEGEEHSGGVGKVDGVSGRGPTHDRYAPSIKLHKHPALQKSQSNMDLSTTEFVDGIRKQKPKNRAPPPPPGAQRDQAKNKLPAGRLTPTSSGTSHRRSQSDLHLSAYPSNPTEEKVEHKSSEQTRVLYKPPSNVCQISMPQGAPPRKPDTHQTHNRHSSGRLSPGQKKSGGSGGESSRRSSQRSPDDPRPEGPVYAAPQIKVHKGQSTQEKGNVYAPLKKRSEERFPNPLGHGDRGGIYSRTNSHDMDPGNVKPKRHAPPPPAVMARGRVSAAGGDETDPRRDASHDYAVVNKLNRLEKRGDKSDPLPRRWGRSHSGERVTSCVAIGPPKPLRTRRVQSIEDLSQLGNLPPILASVPTLCPPPSEAILNSMDMFTIQLRKEPEVSYGLVIVSGKARSGSDEEMIEGVFVQKVLEDSPADKDGRIQSGDMLVQIGAKNLVGGSLEEAIYILRQEPESVRLKIGRPDISSSVFTVNGEDEQPMYANEMVPLAERKLMMKLEMIELQVSQLQGEKEKALNDLVLVRQELDNLRTQSDIKSNELTQALAMVTVEKTKSEQQLETLKLDVAVLRNKLTEVNDQSDSNHKQLKTELEVAKEEMKHLQESNRHFEAELSKDKDLSDSLQKRLTIAESARSKALAELNLLHDKVRNQEEQISTLQIELQQLCKNSLPQHQTTPPDHAHNVHLEPLCLETNHTPSAGVSDNDESDDAFDEVIPSVVTPSPYLSFVPLDRYAGPLADEEASKKGAMESTEQDEYMTSEHTPHTEDVPQSEQTNSIAETDAEDVEHKFFSATATAEFDALGVQAMVLDSTAALHKSKVGGKLRRKKPSKQHLKTMGSSSYILDVSPEGLVDHAPTISEHPAIADTPAVADTTYPHPVPKPRPRPKKSVLAADSKKPQAAPRQKSEDRVVPSPVHPAETAQVEPLVKADEETSPENISTTKDVKQPLHESPSLGKKPHPPLSNSSPSQHSPDISKPTANTPLEVTKEESQKVHISPSPRRKEPMRVPSPKPSPAQSPKHFPKPSPRISGKDHGQSSLTSSREELVVRDHPLDTKEKQSPMIPLRPPKQLEPDLPSQDPPSNKDPSCLTFKEKLAMSRGQSPGSPSRIKFPPPPPRKLGDQLQHGNYQSGEGAPFRRTKSFDDELEASPRRKKLPVGGVNIMGNLGFPGLMSHDHGLLSHDNEPRERSTTISTSEPGERERNSLKRHLTGPDPAPPEQHNELDACNETDFDTAEIKTKPNPPKRPPLPMKTDKPPLTNDPQQRGMADSGCKGESPSVATKYSHSDSESPGTKPRSGCHDNGDSEELNYNEVLTWTPDNVGVWLKKIGLGQYQQKFVDRVIQGYVLFDLDGHRLKGLGVESHDDRSVFKREIKSLRPFADKQKKLIEKQKKEEKKIAKKRNK